MLDKFIDELNNLTKTINNEEKKLQSMKEELEKKKKVLYQNSQFPIELIMPIIIKLINNYTQNNYHFQELCFTPYNKRSINKEYFGIIYNSKATCFDKEKATFWDEIEQGNIHIIYQKNAKAKPQTIIFTNAFKIPKNELITISNKLSDKILNNIINNFIEDIIKERINNHINKINISYLEEKLRIYLKKAPSKTKVKR